MFFGVLITLELLFKKKSNKLGYDESVTKRWILNNSSLFALVVVDVLEK